MPNSALSLSLDFPPFGNLAEIAFAFYKASSLALSDGGAVSVWTDLSPNARNLITNTGNPVFRSSGYVEFDGVDDSLKNESFDLNGLTDITISLCSAYVGSNTNPEEAGPFYIEESGGWGKIFLGMMPDAVRWRFGSGLSGNSQSYLYSGNNPGGGNFATITLIRTVSGTVQERLWVNGSLVDTKNLGSTNLTLANLTSILLLGRGQSQYARHNIKGFAVYAYNAESIRADIEAAIS